MRKLLVLMLVIGVPAGLAATALAATKTVTVGDNFYVRSRGVPTVTVSKGTTVKWVWRGDSRHNVTVMSGPTRFHSATKRSGTYSKTLSRRGRYTIYCTVHGPSDQKMRLVVD